ncbi:MAG: hypothetical protein KatS3mg094_475 [Candidatus Parcubacteria bacterium]|nr:MAG: hypothetical protein KatS3mg094_475 [Candidatus Parcubacteria bacterium]
MKNNKAFTLLESTIILLITTIILGITVSISGINKIFRKFQENIFLLNQDLKQTLRIAMESGEFVLNNTTSTICGSGLVISRENKKYFKVLYATSSTSTVVNCLDISSTSPEVFNFAIYTPSFYISQNDNYITTLNTEDTRDLSFVDNIKIATSSAYIDFNTTSVIFTAPYGEPIIYYSTSNSSYKIDLENNFYIILIKNNETATITISKAGKISSE